MIINPTKVVDFTTYGETLAYAVRDLGTACPDHQTLRMIAWFFSVPIPDVRRDCQETWGKLRNAENTRGGPRG